MIRTFGIRTSSKKSAFLGVWDRTFGRKMSVNHRESVKHQCVGKNDRFRTVFWVRGRPYCAKMGVDNFSNASSHFLYFSTLLSPCCHLLCSPFLFRCLVFFCLIFTFSSLARFGPFCFFCLSWSRISVGLRDTDVQIVRTFRSVAGFKQYMCL